MKINIAQKIAFKADFNYEKPSDKEILKVPASYLEQNCGDENIKYDFKLAENEKSANVIVEFFKKENSIGASSFLTIKRLNLSIPEKLTAQLGEIQTWIERISRY